MITTTEITLTEKQWTIAHDIAIDLVKKQDEIDTGTDGIRTELNKIIDYMYAVKYQEKAGIKLFNYLDELIRNGYKFGHGRNIKQYYQILKEVINEYLKDYQDEENALVILTILGWVERFMRYYKKFPLGEISNPYNKPENGSTPPPPPPPPPKEPTIIFTVDEEVEAEIIKIEETQVQQGNRTQLRTFISYQIEGSTCISKEEVNREKVNLKEGDIITVQIQKVNNGNLVRKVKRVL
jgi:hypothetical protein